MLALIQNSFEPQAAHVIQQPADTVYIGIVNKVNLGGDTTGLLRVESAQATLNISGDTLYIVPRSPGIVDVTCHYTRGVVTRKFISGYLPDPRQRFISVRNARPANF